MFLFYVLRATLIFATPYIYAIYFWMESEEIVYSDGYTEVVYSFDLQTWAGGVFVAIVMFSIWAFVGTFKDWFRACQLNSELENAVKDKSVNFITLTKKKYPVEDAKIVS